MCVTSYLQYGFTLGRCPLHCQVHNLLTPCCKIANGFLQRIKSQHLTQELLRWMADKLSIASIIKHIQNHWLQEYLFTKPLEGASFLNLCTMIYHHSALKMHCTCAHWANLSFVHLLRHNDGVRQVRQADGQ